MSNPQITSPIESVLSQKRREPNPSFPQTRALFHRKLRVFHKHKEKIIIAIAILNQINIRAERHLKQRIQGNVTVTQLDANKKKTTYYLSSSRL